MYHTKSTDVTKALEAKQAYKREIYKYGKEVKYIYTDNSTYTYKECKNAIRDSKQSLAFYSAGVYFQNSKARNKIKIVTLIIQTALINAMLK